MNVLEKRYDIWLGFLFALLLCFGIGKAGEGFKPSSAPLEVQSSAVGQHYHTAAIPESLALFADLAEEGGFSQGEDGMVAFFILPKFCVGLFVAVALLAAHKLSAMTALVYRPDKRADLYHRLPVPFG